VAVRSVEVADWLGRAAEGGGFAGLNVATMAMLRRFWSDMTKGAIEPRSGQEGSRVL